MLSVTKKFHICYGHHLPDYPGKCAEFHGHNSVVEVEFADVDTGVTSYPGMVTDFANIKTCIGPIVEALDHRNLNDIFKRPTAENIVLYLVETIQSAFPETYGAMLSRVRLYETEDSYAEWRADNA